MLPELARTFTLDTWHKTKIESHRRTTLVARRQTLSRSRPNRIDKVWSRFAAHANIEIESADAFSPLPEPSISFGDFNLVLNDHSIAISPDMSAALIWLLLDHNGLLAADLLSLGLDSDNHHDNPMKERSFHAAQYKRIRKCRVTKTMLSSLMIALEGTSLQPLGLISAHIKSQHPKHLTYHQRNLVIWDKILHHLHDDQPINIEEDYLYGALTQSQLADPDMLAMLQSLDSHWQHRVQLMQFLDDVLNGSDAHSQRDALFTASGPLSSNDAVSKLLSGWAVQMRDDRSSVCKVATSLLPAVLSALLLCAPSPALLFDEALISRMYGAMLYCVAVQGSRLKEMASAANEALALCTNVLCEVAMAMDTAHGGYALLCVIVQLLERKSDAKEEKHSKVRLAVGVTVGAMVFGAFGKDLMANEHFVDALGRVLKNGVTDKAEEVRGGAFVVLERMEAEQGSQEMERLLQKWDYDVSKRYAGYKRLKLRKRGGGKRKRIKRQHKKKVEAEKKKEKAKEKEVVSVAEAVEPGQAKSPHRDKGDVLGQEVAMSSPDRELEPGAEVDV